jgi:hypothetical protein
MPKTFIDKLCNVRRPTITKVRGSEDSADVVLFTGIKCDFWASRATSSMAQSDFAINTDKKNFEVVLNPEYKTIKTGDIVELITPETVSMGKFKVVSSEVLKLPNGKIDSVYLLVTSR